MRMIASMILLAAVGVSPAPAAGLGEAAELEAARAHARAGGPVSERHKELLERYGCTSGTRAAICQRSSLRRSQDHPFSLLNDRPRPRGLR